MTIGFIGTGTITAHVVAGILGAAPTTRIAVTRRSERVSEALVARFPQVERVDTPAEIAAACDTVVLAVRPAQLEAALAGITFGTQQTVISFIGNLRLPEVQLLAPQSRVARVVPLPMIERREGPLLACPDLPEIRAIFAGLGDYVGVDADEQLSALMALTAFMSSYFELHNSLADWAVGQGVDAAQSGRFTASLLAALARTGLATEPSARRELVAAHETPGGLNAYVRRTLGETGWFDKPATAFDGIGRLRRDDLKASGD